MGKKGAKIQYLIFRIYNFDIIGIEGNYIELVEA
jgi:hypothetical protein